MKKILLRIHWILSEQFGINVLKLLNGFRGLFQFITDLKSFKTQYAGKIVLVPCLGDRYSEGGNAKDEYFRQDLLVARWVFQNKPIKHVDIGSRIDGFVAHVASFREIEVFDIRNISTSVENICFKQADLMSETSIQSYISNIDGYCDSLSCLHALEHFGLGRYGDNISATGYEQGIKNISMLLKSGGMFYLSVPVGFERVEFNANWIFSPFTIIKTAKSNGLNLSKMHVLMRDGSELVYESQENFEYLSKVDYALCIFIFIKN